MKRAAFKRILFRAVQMTWGFPQTFAGAVLFLFQNGRPRSRYRGAVVTEWKPRGSVSLGMFLFLSAEALGCAGERLLRHEYGHAVQSLILGPLYLPLVGLPSLLWALRFRLRKNRRTKRAYGSFYTERTADRLGGNGGKQKKPQAETVA